MRLVEQTPDPSRHWIRYAMRPWPGEAALWADLGGEGLGEGTSSPADLEVPESVGALDDVVYMPPVSAGHESLRSELAKQLLESGVPVLIQSLAGQESTAPEGTLVCDVLQAVATNELSLLDSVPSGSSALWPLIGGYTDDPAIWREGLERLATAGVVHVQGLALDLQPADRRRVVEVAGDRGFERLFHGSVPSERAFAAAVHRAGLNPFSSRPLPSGPSRLVHNRQLAGFLVSIADLWLRLGRAESRGHSFYRSARWVDRESHDLALLAREGNLSVVDWLDTHSRAVIEETAATGTSSLLEELRQEFLLQSPETG